jgi:hypothetical protein
MRPLRRSRLSADRKLDSLRRRCLLGTISAGAGYVVTFITDIVRSTPSDDTIIIGLEMAFLASGLLAGIIAAIAWALDEHTARADTVHADELAWTLQLGSRIADAYPIPPRSESADPISIL